MLFGMTNLYQNTAIIVSTKCVNDDQCPFNTGSLDHKHSFSFSQVPVHMMKKGGMTSRYILFQLTLFQELLFKNKHDM